MIVRYCSICNNAFDVDEEGDEGMIGMIPFAFCGICRAGVVEYVDNRELIDLGVHSASDAL